jgi:hypothetical protein
MEIHSRQDFKARQRYPRGTPRHMKQCIVRDR